MKIVLGVLGLKRNLDHIWMVKSITVSTNFGGRIARNTSEIEDNLLMTVAHQSLTGRKHHNCDQLQRPIPPRMDVVWRSAAQIVQLIMFNNETLYSMRRTRDEEVAIIHGVNNRKMDISSSIGTIGRRRTPFRARSHPNGQTSAALEHSSL